MAKGRKAVAAEIQEASGAYKKNPQRRKEVLRATKGIPAKPDHIESIPEASRCWDHTIDQLRAMDILTEADLDLLTLYCETMALRLQAFRDHEPSLYNRLCVTCLRYIGELGLSPSARMRLAAPKEEDKDAFTEWLAGYSGGVALSDN